MTNFAEKSKLIRLLKTKIDRPQRVAKILNKSVIKRQRGYSAGKTPPMGNNSNFTYTVISFEMTITTLKQGLSVVREL